jgi:epoxide hydrolase
VVVRDWVASVSLTIRAMLVASSENAARSSAGRIQRVHFAHVTSAEPGAVPLLLTHGWPGSFLEFLGLIGPLTDPAAHGGDPSDAVHLVVPSLPGFGFSTPLTSGGWTTASIAAAWVQLMDRLGYDRFAVQGGDIGAAVSPEVGRVAPERVIGVHVNGALGFAADIDEETLAAMAPVDRGRVARIRAFMREEYGYIAIQSTRPGLIGVALADSPPPSSRGCSINCAPGPTRPPRFPTVSWRASGSWPTPRCTG